MALNQKEIKKLSYEDALLELEDIVRRLEIGDVPLEQALIVYQQGVELLAHCQKILANVEEKLTILNVAEGEK